MTTIHISDSVDIGDSALRLTKDGYLVGDARVARTGVQVYRGAELGIKDRDTLRVYRSEEEVFSSDAMKSYAYRPVTVNHPRTPVDSGNWSEHAVGQTGGDVVRDGQFVRVPMVLMDREAVDLVKSGVRELSMGYSCQIELRDGISPEGEEYDAVMSQLRMNHLAVVPRARGGSVLKLGDGEETMGDAIKTQTVVVDGLSIETTSQGAQVIEKLQKQIADAATAHTKVVADATEAKKSFDKELAAKDAEIEKLKAAQTTDAQLDARVAERSAVVDAARALVDKFDPTGKSNDQIRTEVVRAKVADAKVLDGKSQDYINARFDAMVEGAKGQDKFRTAMRDGAQSNLQSTQVVDANKAYADSVAAMTDAWKPQEAH